MARDIVDISPQQYHAGLDKLLTALGLTGVQDDDVFTIASREIERWRIVESAAWRLLEAWDADTSFETVENDLEALRGYLLDRR